MNCQDMCDQLYKKTSMWGEITATKPLVIDSLLQTFDLLIR